MGIKGLAKLLSDEAPDVRNVKLFPENDDVVWIYGRLISQPSLLLLKCIREVELKSLHGRKIAVDASMAIYQFLIAVRSGGPNHAATMLTNADGETTSHIQGMFNRTIRFLTEGIKPCFVFDGKRCTALLLGKVAFLPVLAAAPPTAQGATPVTASGGCFAVAPAPEPAAQGATPVTVSGG